MIVDQKYGDDPTVICPTSGENRLNKYKLFLDQFPLRFMKTENKELHSLAWVEGSAFKIASKRKPDLIQLHWICLGHLTVEAVSKFQRPIVWRFSDMWPFCGAEHYTDDSTRYSEGYSKANRPKWETGLDLCRWVWERKKKSWKKLNNLTIVAPSTWMANCAKRSYLFKNTRIELIPTGIDTVLFRPVPKEYARTILKLPKDKKIILFGASNANDKRKGFNYLENAIIDLNNRGMLTGCELLVFGNSFKSGLSIPHIKINYIGQVHDQLFLPVVYSAADIFIAPSILDNLANTVLEAMSCGTPVIAFAIGGMPDAIDDGINGFLAKTISHECLAKAILSALNNYAQLDKFSITARMKITEQFSNEMQAQRFIKLYEDILGRGQHGDPCQHN
jgi:glycosyltransferase involved in cell wall biosynthesis